LPGLVSYPELPGAPYLLERWVPVRRTEAEDDPFRPAGSRVAKQTPKVPPPSDVDLPSRPDPAASEEVTSPPPALAPSRVESLRQRVGSSVVSRPPPLPSLPGDGLPTAALAPVIPSRVATPVETVEDPAPPPLMSRPPPLPPLPEPVA